MTDIINDTEVIAEATDPEISVTEDNSTDDVRIEESTVDYEALIKEDVAALKARFPELSDINDVTDLDNPMRYAALRDLGLTPTEAYLATSKRSVNDTRSHLRRAHGRSASSPVGMMSQSELAAARDLFPGKSDADIQRLYKRVSG